MSSSVGILWKMTQWPSWMVKGIDILLLKVEALMTSIGLGGIINFHSRLPKVVRADQSFSLWDPNTVYCRCKCFINPYDHFTFYSEDYSYS